MQRAFAACEGGTRFKIAQVCSVHAANGIGQIFSTGPAFAQDDLQSESSHHKNTRARQSSDTCGIDSGKGLWSHEKRRALHLQHTQGTLHRLLGLGQAAMRSKPQTAYMRPSVIWHAAGFHYQTHTVASEHLFLTCAKQVCPRTWHLTAHVPTSMHGRPSRLRRSQ